MATSTSDTLPFALDERILVRSSSNDSTETTTKTVRLESLAQWSSESWIHPFADIDLLSGHKISKVDMSISSHGAQEFPSRSTSLDHVPLLPSDSSDERYLSKPQGFFLSIVPVNGLTQEEEAQAVQSVFEELIRSRLLNTPVTDGEWDIVVEEDGSRRSYQLILPFDGAGWSSDALAQSFRKTLPNVCGNNTNGFFGWSALEWSNFLVGYKDGGGRGRKQPLQHPTYNKFMWWTWESSKSKEDFSFGIQYQTTIPEHIEDWLPKEFLNKESNCPFGRRASFQVLSPATATTDHSYQLVPMTIQNEGETIEENEETLTSDLSYSVGIEQVLRRHHTNRGRFESFIHFNPLFDIDNNASLSCQMKYRQVFPNFLSPTWQSLQIIDGETNGTLNVGDAYYTNSDQLRASVEWNQEEQSSILTVEASSDAERAVLPSSIAVSLEYAPTFLTLDDFPGDPNRGRVLPPATVTVRCAPMNTKTTVYSNSLLLLPPVPDLSMPFNVISLTSSLYAYIIGAIITILVRKGSEKIKYKVYPDKKPLSKIAKLKTKLREKFGRIRSKFSGKTNADTNQKDDRQPESSSGASNADSIER